MKTKLAIVLGTWFGCGFSAVAPGTVGSLGALIPACLLSYYFGWPLWIWAIAAALITIPGIWAATLTAAHAGKKDPGLVVIDEVAGQWLTLAGATVLNWKTALAAFLLFRLLDIWKPPPARQFEKFPTGTGIMADDLMAGIYGGAILWIVTAWIAV